MRKKDYTIRIGLQTFAAIAAFFFLMRAFGLDHVTELRFFNILIVAFFSNRLAHLYVVDENRIDYINGLRSIFLANAIAVILSILGLVAYINLVDPLLLDNFKEGLLLAGEASISKIAAALLLEGMAGSVVVSFATMQYWKDVRRSTRSIDLHKA